MAIPAREVTGKGDGKGQQEDGFDIEDEKDDGVQIIAGLELDPGVACRIPGRTRRSAFLLGPGLCGENFHAQSHASAAAPTANATPASNSTMTGR